MIPRKNKPALSHGPSQSCIALISSACLTFMTACGGEQPPAAMPSDAKVPEVSDRELFEPEMLSAFDEAIGKVRSSPSPKNWSELGRIYHAHEQLQIAIDCYQAAIDAGDTANRTGHLLALAFDELGSRESAISSMRRAATLLPSNPTSGWRLAQWVAEEGDPEEARSIFLRTLSMAPNDFGSLLAYGKFQLDMGRPKNALESLSKAAILQPKIPYPRFLLGKAMLEAGMEDEGAKQIQLGRGSTPSWPDLHLQQLNGLVRGPLADLRRLTRISDNGQPEQVLSPMLLLAERLKDSPNYHIQLAKVYRRLERLTEAETSIARALDIQPENPEAMYQHAGLKRQRWLATPDRDASNPFLGEALELIDQSLKIRPSAAHSHGLRAQILAGLGRLDESSEEWLTAHGLSNKRQGFDMQSAMVYIDAEQWEKASERLQDLVTTYPDDLPLRRMFGLTLFKAGNRDLARGVLQSVEQHMPDDPEVLAVLEKLR